MNTLKKFPEAKTALLVWYKCFAYREGSIDRYKDHPISSSIIQGSSNLDVINYSVFYKINPWLKVACIEFFETPAQTSKRRKDEREKYRLENPEITVVTETIVIESVALDIDDDFFLDPDLPVPEEVDDDVPIPKPLFFSYKSNYTIENAGDYETALNRTNDLFESKPGLAEYEELSGLVGAIKIYEDKSIQIPELDAIEIIEWQMKTLQEIPAYLLHIFAKETDVTDFLAGKKSISLKQLKALSKHYSIQFLYPKLEESLIKRNLIN